MNLRVKVIFCTFLIIISLIPSTVRATVDSTNSAGFGYGVRVDLWGENSQAAIQEAGNFNLDWIAIDFNWQRLQPKANHSPTWYLLDAAMSNAEEKQLSVMLAITEAPDWARDKNGPHPQKTAELASELVRRYPDIPLALELFPSANTKRGWGETPNPKAYASLLKAITQAVLQINPDTIIVGASLTPLTRNSSGMEDEEFLKELYTADIAEYLPVVGLRLPPLGNHPLTPTHQASEILLRHYENIRSIMLENGHKNGLIWITGFSWDESSLNNPNDQSTWMKQAYLLFRSQLYIGAAFFDGLNPSQSTSATLLLQNGNFHPGFEELIQVIAQDHNSQIIQISLGLSKEISSKSYVKVISP